MKLSEVAKAHGFNEADFDNFLARKPQIKTSGMASTKIADEDVEKAVDLYVEEVLKPREEKRLAIEQEHLAIEQERIRKELPRQQAMAAMLVTSGFNFDGYTIKRYSGYISGDDAIQINRDELFAGQGQVLTDALVQIRIQALKELKEAAYDLGCNAIIGVDFDYITFEPETISAGGGTHYYMPYVVCVTANGNAVVIEKNL